MNEVRISLGRDISELSRLEIDLQKTFGIPEAVVAPLSAGGDPRLVIGAARGSIHNRSPAAGNEDRTWLGAYAV